MSKTSQETATEARNEYLDKYGEDQFDAMRVVLDFIGSSPDTPERKKALDALDLILRSWNVEDAEGEGDDDE